MKREEEKKVYVVGMYDLDMHDYEIVDCGIDQFLLVTHVGLKGD